MADEKPVHEQVQDLLNSWNPPAESNRLQTLIGVPTDEASVAATAHVRHPGLDHDKNPASDGVDAASLFADDADDGAGLPEVPTDDDGNPDYDSMKNADLQEHLRARDLPVSGNHSELVSRLEEDDADDGDDEDDDD